MSQVFDLTEQDFAERVIAASHQNPVLVDISADWCSPCRVLAPLLQQAVAEAGGAVRLAIVDADENMRIAGRHQVRGFPTVIGYSRGVEVARFQSVQTPAFLRAFIDTLLRAHQSAATGAEVGAV